MENITAPYWTSSAVRGVEHDAGVSANRAEIRATVSNGDDLSHRIRSLCDDRVLEKSCMLLLPAAGGFVFKRVDVLFSYSLKPLFQNNYDLTK